RSAPPCAWARTIDTPETTSAAEPVRRARRDIFMSASQKGAAHVGVARQLGRGAARAVAAVDQDVAAVRDRQRFQRVLLDHRDGDAILIDREDRFKEFFG